LSDLSGGKLMGGCELDSSGLGNDPAAGSCENGNEPSGSIKGGKFLEWLSNWQRLKEASVPWSYYNYYHYYNYYFIISIKLYWT
jgi:hypothetical protein